MKNQRLKSALKQLTGTMAVVLLGAGIFGPDALAGIANTKHNLTGTAGATMPDGTTRINSFSPTAGNGEICVFCHTPHGSDNTAAVPLWNRSLGSKGAAYTTYNSLGTSSLDGSVAPVGSVSLACLSCHDGTQAMNVMINKPGSGGYVAAGSALTGTWTGANQDGTGKLANAVSLIGTDLTNDHPIGIQYGGGPKSGVTIPTTGTYPNTSFRDADFKTANVITLNNMPVWWVDSEATGNGTREKTDMQLYTRKSTGDTLLTDNGGNPQPFVECASCHDPHSENVTFLRMTDGNKNSQICLACHTK